MSCHCSLEKRRKNVFKESSFVQEGLTKFKSIARGINCRKGTTYPLDKVKFFQEFEVKISVPSVSPSSLDIKIVPTRERAEFSSKVY